jgi:uncharacterized protein
VRIAASADLHCRVESGPEVEHLLRGVSDRADVLLLGGDLTNLGLPEEMEVLLAALHTVSAAKVAVTGNHDFESGEHDMLVQMMRQAGIVVLQGDFWEFEGVGFAGTKGFAGGFGTRQLMSFGEPAIKEFAGVARAEAEGLERALKRLRTPRKVALLHYSPIAETLVGEPPEIYPFLGHTQLARALERGGADVAVHGHAHHGSLAGRTEGGVPVLNASRYVVSRHTGRSYVTFDVTPAHAGLSRLSAF